MVDTKKKGIQEKPGKKMTQKTIETISNILNRQDFKYTKCSRETRVKVIAIMIELDPIAEQVRKAREKTDKEFMGERLKRLMPTALRGSFKSEEEVEEFGKLYEPYKKSHDGVMDPILEKQVAVNIKKLSQKEFNEIFEANADWMGGEIPKVLFVNVVETEAEGEEVQELEGEC